MAISGGIVDNSVAERKDGSIVLLNPTEAAVDRLPEVIQLRNRMKLDA